MSNSLIPCIVSFLAPAKEALEWVCGNQFALILNVGDASRLEPGLNP